MRFAEKSFEVRFCAALSAALMPFNRNPQWFGMTQAQERMTGIDTMISLGGRLTIFQFKAKQKNQFRLEKRQWEKITGIGQRYQRSTYYVFPEAEDVNQAASVRCILNHSWVSLAADLGPSFKPDADSATLTLDASNSNLMKKKPSLSIPTKTACEAFGCFCEPYVDFLHFHTRRGEFHFHFSSPHAHGEARTDQPLAPYSDNFGGIPLGETSGDNPDQRAIRTIAGFEELLGDQANTNLAPGLFGLFFPRAEQN